MRGVRPWSRRTEQPPSPQGPSRKERERLDGGACWFLSAQFWPAQSSCLAYYRAAKGRDSKGTCNLICVQILRVGTETEPRLVREHFQVICCWCMITSHSVPSRCPNVKFWKCSHARVVS